MKVSYDRKSDILMIQVWKEKIDYAEELTRAIDTLPELVRKFMAGAASPPAQ